MKKSNVILVLICLVGFWVVSCVKENDSINTNVKKVDKSSTAQLVKQLKTNSYEGTYLMASQIGHKRTVCKGKCKYANGVWFHTDCQGYGHECNLRAEINISKNMPEDTTDIYYTGIGINDYEPTGDSTFSMPARSFYFEGEQFENGYIYINIPEQELLRDEETYQFIYYDITFTEEPLYENL